MLLKTSIKRTNVQNTRQVRETRNAIHIHQRDKPIQKRRVKQTRNAISHPPDVQILTVQLTRFL